jgi:probable HAF family extracellular repeat protein
MVVSNEDSKSAPSSSVSGSASLKFQWLSRIGNASLTIAVLWLALKDWFFSDAPDFPYLQSLMLTLAILLPVAGAYLIAHRYKNADALMLQSGIRARACEVWRTTILSIATALCLISLFHLFEVKTVVSVPPPIHSAVSAASTVLRRLPQATASLVNVRETTENRPGDLVIHSPHFELAAALVPTAAIILIVFGLPYPLLSKRLRGTELSGPSRIAYNLQSLIVLVGVLALIDPIGLFMTQTGNAVLRYSPLGWVGQLDWRIFIVSLVVVVSFAERFSLDRLSRITGPGQRRIGWISFYVVNAAITFFSYLWFGPYKFGFCNLVFLSGDLQAFLAPPLNIHNLLLGTGITVNQLKIQDWEDAVSWIQFFATVGLISIVLAAIIFLSVYVRSIVVLCKIRTVEAPDRAPANFPQNDGTTETGATLGLNLVAGSFALLICIPLCLAATRDYMYSWVAIGAGAMTVALASLSLSNYSVSPRERTADVNQAAPVGVFGRRIVAGGVLLFLLGYVTAFGVTFRVAKSLTSNGMKQGRGAEVPPGVRAALGATPLATTWQAFHDKLRQSCSAPDVLAPPTFSASLMRNYLRNEKLGQPNSNVSLFDTVMGLFLSSMVSSDDLTSAYLNGIDYGLPKSGSATTDGLEAAAQFYFNEPSSRLSTSQAVFLINTGGPTGQSRFRFKNVAPYPSVRNATSAVYKISLPPQPYIVNHSGQINNHGDILIKVWLGDIWYIVKNGRMSQLNGMSPQDINDYGQMAGGECLWQANGNAIDIGELPGYGSMSAQSLNDKGDVVGYASAPNGQQSALLGPFVAQTRAFIWSHGRLSALELPRGYKASRAFSINNVDEVAGWMLTDDNRTHATVWEDGSAHDLGCFPGGQVSVAVSLNNAGQVAGDAQLGDGKVDGFLWQDGIMHDIGRLPGFEKAHPYKINDLGQIVGACFTGDINSLSPGTGFVWDGVNGMRDLRSQVGLNQATCKLMLQCTAYGINNHGQILGMYCPILQRHVLYILNPTRRFDPNR